jgi:hypothetical protein
MLAYGIEADDYATTGAKHRALMFEYVRLPGCQRRITPRRDTNMAQGLQPR